MRRRAEEHTPFAPLQRLEAALDAVAELPVVESARQLAAARRALATLLREKRWLDRYGRGQPPFLRQPSGLLALRTAPRYTILVGSFPPRTGSGIHDHKTWGLIGTWAGQEVEARYKITASADDGRVRFAETGGTVNAAGCVSLLIPDVDEIHLVGNVRPRPAYSVHIYGYGSEVPGGRGTKYRYPDGDGWSRPIVRGPR